MTALTTKRRSAQRRKRRQGAAHWRGKLLTAVWGDEAATTPTREARGGRLRAYGVAIGAFALLALVATWPLALHFRTAVLSDGGDALQNYWNYWWLREALASGRNPFTTPYLYAPYGAPLYLHTLTPLNGLLSLPVQLLFGPVVAYNAVVCCSLIFAGYATALLVAHLSGNRAAGLIGGVIYAFGSYQMTHLLGHTNLLTSGWIPLCLLAFVRATEARGRRRTRFTLATAALLVLMMLAEWQYLLFTLALLAFLAVWFASTRRAVAPVLIATIGVLIWACIALPLLLATVAEVRGGLVSPPDPDGARIYSADVMSFILPAERQTFWGAWATRARIRLPAPAIEGDIFLGWVPLALALWALIVDRRRAAPWAAVGLIFAVLALGPVLHIRGDWRWDGPNGTLRTIAMPFALVQQLPGLNFLRVPVRFALVVTLALAVLGGLAIAQLARRWPTLGRPTRAVPLVGLLAALLLAEHLAIPFPLEDTAVPPFYRQLAHSAEQGTILEWPLSFKSARSSLYQTVHRRPLMGGYIARRLNYPVRALPPFRELSGEATDIYAPPAGAEYFGSWVLDWSGVRWVVFSPDTPTYSEQDLVNFQRTYATGEPIYRDARTIVLRPRPPSGTATAFFGGAGWYERESSGGGGTGLRWFAASADFTVWYFGEQPGSYALRFDAASFHQPRRLEVWLDGERLGEWRVTDTQRFDLPVILTNGPHQVTLRSLDPALSPVSVGMGGGDTRPLAFAIANVRLER